MQRRQYSNGSRRESEKQRMRLLQANDEKK